MDRWEHNLKKANLSEIWTKQNDYTFYGESYFVIKNDSVSAETIQLQQHNRVLSNFVSVPNQNEKQPVTFEMTENSNGVLILENSNHDYPTKIIYLQVGTDRLVAEIIGIKDGKFTNEFFKIKKK